METIRRQKCLIWTRVSSQEQVENGSLNVQLTMCTEYAQKLGFKVIDHESAYESAKEENIRFKLMIKRLTDVRNQYDAVIVLSASRFSRYLPIGSNILVELKTKGIYLHVVRGELNSETGSGEISIFQEFLKANQENQERKEITVISRMAKLKQGITASKAPLGYIPSSTKGKLDNNHNLMPSIVPCPEKAPIIRKAFKLLLQRKSLTEITAEVNSLGLNLSRKYLGELLRKPIYCGRIVDKTLKDAGKPFIMGKHESLISVSEFERVQKLLTHKALKRKKKTNEEEVALNGILKCCKCGKNLSGYLTKGLPYYKCNHGCKLNLSGKEIHTKSLHLLSSLILDKDHETQIHNSIQANFDERFSDIITQHQVKQAGLAKLTKRLENLLISKLDGEIDERDYTRIRKQTEDKISLIENELSSMRVPDIMDLHSKVVFLLRNPSTFYQRLNAYDKKRLLKTLTKGGLTYNKQEKEFENTTFTQLYVLTKPNNQLTA